MKWMFEVVGGAPVLDNLEHGLKSAHFHIGDISDDHEGANYWLTSEHFNGLVDKNVAYSAALGAVQLLNGISSFFGGFENIEFSGRIDIRRVVSTEFDRPGDMGWDTHQIDSDIPASNPFILGKVRSSRFFPVRQSHLAISARKTMAFDHLLLPEYPFHGIQADLSYARSI